MKRCPTCKTLKEEFKFCKNKRSKDGLRGQCKKCSYASAKKRYERIGYPSPNHVRKLRKEMIEAYGSSCECCEESEIAFLTLDHKNGGGGAERKKFGNTQLYLQSLKKRGWPKEEYRLLCSNCNMAEHFQLGGCPHKRSV